MQHLPVEKLWGVSHQLGKRLRALGICTALQLRNSATKYIRQHFGVIGERIVYELRGVSCLEIEKIAPKKTIMSSKSFSATLNDISDIEEALADYAARACEKLRVGNHRVVYSIL